MRHAPVRGTRVPTRLVWELRWIWGNCPIPMSIEVESLRVSDQSLVALRPLAELVRRVSRAVFLESLAQETGLLKTLE